MAHYNFKDDLYEGNKGENTVIEHLKKLGGHLLSKNNDNRFDAAIERNGKILKYEIKTDFYCVPIRDTGNMFIEVECRGKPSGIMVTKADWFVTYYNGLNEIWYIKTKDLLQLIDKNKDELYLHPNSGDEGSGTQGWLIPRRKFSDEFLVYDSRTFKRIKNV